MLSVLRQRYGDILEGLQNTDQQSRLKGVHVRSSIEKHHFIFHEVQAMLIGAKYTARSATEALMSPYFECHQTAEVRPRQPTQALAPRVHA